jgi:hypothetical protein
MSRELNGWSREHNCCVMRNLKGGHRILKSQFLFHIFAVHFERSTFELSKYNSICKNTALNYKR